MELPYGDLECLVWYVILARYLACVARFFDRAAVLRMVIGVAHWLSLDFILHTIHFELARLAAGTIQMSKIFYQNRRFVNVWHGSD